ncbi:MAG: Gfo/Idh/MocA family oxidoreductase [Bacteroidales bacterium]|nr:Gfo/Idh/MocA family oxidoreductase [Bacteroidales bacterium]
MENRRSFVKKMGKGALYSSMALSHPAAFAAKSFPVMNPGDKPIRIGIIGAENSHTRGYGKLFNVDKKFPGVEVLYVWGETEEFARDAMVRGSIPNMVKDPMEMLGKIDALIVDHRHAKYHLEAAAPFVKAGIATFIDKPFCYRIDEGRDFLAMARERGTPVTSYSSIAHSEATFDIKQQVESLGDINQVVRYGPADLDSKYGGVFFYGVHSVQPLLYMFGEDVEKVKISREGKNGNATLVFQSGLFATLIFQSVSYGWTTFVESGDGMIELKSRVEEKDPPKNYADMVEMFRTGKEPRSHESILSCVAVLEALERSAASQRWEKVNL